jgi:hypothetical protein
VGAFHEGVREANERLATFGARLMPGAMHPWMDPATETRLWPHEYTDVYRAFDRIFGTSGHGWANLQSTHLNLPFAGDDDFGRLHAAIRLVLPLIPALAAASPFLDGGRGPALDGRLVMYRGNARRVPSVSGSVVPEPAFSRAEYERDVLGRIYADLAPLDPEGVLRHEWVNARGAIARFDRGAIEVRVIDAQECPSADVAVVAAVTEVVRALADGPLAARDLRADPTTESLACLLEATTLQADAATIDDDSYLRVLGAAGLGAGVGRAGRPTAGELWCELMDRFPPSDPSGEWAHALETLLADGPLARRMLAATGGADVIEAPGGAKQLRGLYVELCACLERNEPFRP